jgi:hypothetical protein
MAMAVREHLGLGEETMPWLEELQALGAPDQPISLPSPEEAPALPARLGVPGEQVAEVVDARPCPERDPALWWVLTRCYRLLVKDMGGFGQLRSWPSMPADLGQPGRYVYVWVFLATLDAVRAYHAARGIPGDVSWATLADLGQHLALHRRIRGDAGLSAQNWLTLHFRGGIYQLGRLQFNRGRIYYDAATVEKLGAPFRHGDPCLGTHIPDTGPLTPEACDASFRWAREFFARHFPEDRYCVATCGSWLLDEQLAEYLPATSNIMRFQHLFHPTPVSWDADREIIRFVFRRATSNLDELPRRTTLERAIVQHLRAGRHWRGRSGWLEL